MTAAQSGAVLAAPGRPRVGLPDPHRTVLLALLGLQALVAVIFALRATTDLFGTGHDQFWSGGVYQVALLISVVVCGWRSVVDRADRTPWLLITAALVVYCAGDLYWSFVIEPMADPPYPSLADALYLAWYLPMFAGMVLLVGSGPARLSLVVLLRAAVGALVLGSILAAVTLDPRVTALEGTTAEVLTALAYPSLDVVLLIVVAGALIAQQGRAGRQFTLLAGGLLLFAAADAVYLVQAASDAYTAGGPVDIGWVLGAVCIAHAAWSPREQRDIDRERASRFDAISSTVFACLLVGMLGYMTLGDPPSAAKVLVAAGVVVLLGEQAISKRALRRLTDRHDAMSEDLHDNVLQHVLAARQDLELASQGDAEALTYARSALESLVVELRTVMLALRPARLAATEVADALTDAVADLVRRQDVRLHVDLPARVIGPHADLVFGIARELVANAARHAQATVISAEARLVDDDDLELLITDDGIGLLPDRRKSAERGGHLGLVLVARRVERAGGTLRITAGRGVGTTIVARIPRP
ncbi:sensor histidine kinase [Paraconexibacter sp.]|uniref:sensor histidine kinase n=1 Tax=Paraconexibacter sp. TaxID=2949640 RepID=UPI003563A620